MTASTVTVRPVLYPDKDLQGHTKPRVSVSRIATLATRMTMI